MKRFVLNFIQLLSVGFISAITYRAYGISWQFALAFISCICIWLTEFVMGETESMR